MVGEIKFQDYLAIKPTLIRLLEQTEIHHGVMTQIH